MKAKVVFIFYVLMADCIVIREMGPVPKKSGIQGKLK